ncbi:MAG: penicillin-binding protein, partial [Erysipelotrichia bacterium]|nr:penicillin-binding protein [Erysipelotrichia bacterium]
MFKLIRRLLMILIILVLFVVCIFAGWGYLDYKKATDEMSVEDKVAMIESKPHYVKADDISQHFKDAIVAIEDHRFYTHHGIDYISLVRITLANIMAQEVLGGGSTITQQLAKNMYFDQNMSMNRKVSEAFVANALEHAYSKEKILELYMN